MKTRLGVAMSLLLAGSAMAQTVLLSAEQVAERAAAEVQTLLAADAPVGEHLADQLLIPMALAGGGAFRTVAPSLHTRTNAAVVERFLPVAIAMREDTAAGNWVVEVRAR